MVYSWLIGILVAHLAAVSGVYLVHHLRAEPDRSRFCLQSRTALALVLAVSSSLAAAVPGYSTGLALLGLLGWSLLVLALVVMVPLRLTGPLGGRGPLAAAARLPMRFFVLPLGRATCRLTELAAGRAAGSLERSCARELGVLFSPDPVRVLRSEPLVSVLKEFGRTVAEDIMIPRSAMVAAASSDTLADCVDVFAAEGFSRLPVHEGDLESVIGIVHVMDLLRETDLSKTVRQIVRPVLLIPQSKACDELLKEFQKSQSYMAIVLDEYGGVAGLVTVEDVLEELVGEMGEEPARLRRLVRRVSEGEFSVQAQVEIEKFESVTGIKLRRGDYETLAGFLLEEFGRIPEAGAKVRKGGALYEVVAADARRIKVVRVTVGHREPRSEADT
ncbi:MAG: HlyC/CorC family transporter [Candidatus Eiseniibacteriota bacterium]|nr:MAG: HlyC/CorC family transporter [Candidatus Eisenbacteria bacterium]